MLGITQEEHHENDRPGSVHRSRHRRRCGRCGGADGRIHDQRLDDRAARARHGVECEKQILGENVYNDAGDKVREINDLIVTPDKALSYAIVGVGGFLGVAEHEIAVPVGQLKQQQGKIVLPGATKDALKAAPKFEYAK